jgi:hypothetical protein
VSCPINNLLDPPANFRARQGAPTRLLRLLKPLEVAAVALVTLTLAANAIAQSGQIAFQMLTVPSNLNVSESRSSAVIRSTRDWNVWINNLPELAEDLPTVDFEQYTLLVVNAGYKINGPYEVKFDSVTDAGNTIRVHVSVAGPTSCPKESVAGHYVAMAVIPRTDKPIEFDVSTRDSACARR